LRAASFSRLLDLVHNFALLLFLLGAGVVSTQAEILYSTDFENFPTGDRAWGGFDGWVSTDTTSAAQGIYLDPVVGQALGNTAALGFNQPASPFISVFRNVDYDPVVEGNPLIEVNFFFGIDDSTALTDFRRDDFFFSFYNTNGDPLAFIRASNTEADFGFWWQDGVTQSYTGLGFIHEELHDLNIRIDLSGNRWSALLDSVPLFENETFTSTGLPRSLGPVAIEWLVAAGTASGYGDNWMLLDLVSIETIESEPPPLVIDSIVHEPNFQISLQWEAGVGYQYSVEYSHDLEIWLTALPNSTFPTPLYRGTLTYTDQSADSNSGRYYRIRRDPVATTP
jgi:hypothetical protein